MATPIALVLTLIAAVDSGSPDAAAPEAGPHPDAPPESPAPPPPPAPVAPPPSVPAPPAPPHPATIAGTVFERGTRQGIAGVTITVDGAPVADTEADGTFVAPVAPGLHVVEAQLGDFETRQSIVQALPDRTARIQLRLVRRSDAVPYETVVSAEPWRPPRIGVSGQEARRTPGGAGDPFRVIESLPGVAQIQWPLALYAIRGANPGNTGFFVDGMRVPALFHFLLGPSIVHPYMIDQLDFYPGGYPAPLGGYVSGVVAATTAPAPADLAHASADVRVYDAGAIVSAPWDGGRGTIAVAGRYSYTGAIAAALFPDVQLGYGDYQLRADHALGGGRATLLAIGSFDSLSSTLNVRGDAALQFHRMDLRWDRRVGPGWLRARATAGADYARSTLDDDAITMRSYALAPRLEYHLPIDPRTQGGGSASLDLGASAELQRFRPNVPMMPGAPTLDDVARARDAATAAAYLAFAAATGGGRLALSLGLRFAAYAEQGVVRLAPEPRLSARLRLGARLVVNGAAGLFSQMPSLPVGVPGFEAFDLRDLGLQRSAQVSLGPEATLGAGWTASVTGFYQQLRLSDVRSTFDSDLRRMDYLEMRPGRAYGVEVLIRRRAAERLSGWLAYTLSRSERAIEGVFGPSDWDQRHILNLLAMYRLGGGYSVGARFHYHTGRPYPTVSPDGSSGTVYRRLPPFPELDLRADKRIVFERWRLDVYVELGNATLNKEVTGYSTALAGGRDMPALAPVEDGYRIVLPTIGVHGEY